MKPSKYLAIALAALVAPSAAGAQEMFTGDTKLACEAVLCLASGTRPSECTPSLRRYFSIDARKLSDTIRKRKNFLEMCPSASADQSMKDLTDALSRGAGRCDVDALNRNTRRLRHHDDDGGIWIDSQMPSYCAKLYGHPYLSVTLPRYVGEPGQGGRWVPADEYEAALAEYNAQQQQRQSNGWDGHGWTGSTGTGNR